MRCTGLGFQLKKIAVVSREKIWPTTMAPSRAPRAGELLPARLVCPHVSAARLRCSHAPLLSQTWRPGTLVQAPAALHACAAVRSAPAARTGALPGVQGRVPCTELPGRLPALSDSVDQCQSQTLVVGSAPLCH